jgi:hypothetical protein
MCLLAACGPNIKTKEKVREDLLTHLQKAGLDTKALEIDITQVTFDKNQAHAAVSFRPKGVTSVHDGMMMSYTLESRDGHWVVTGRADSQGHGSSRPPAENGTSGAPNLPPGHPPMGGLAAPNGSPNGQNPSQLPPGHPQVQPGQGSAPPAGAKPLPPGHPKVSLLRTDGKFAGETGTRVGTGLAA